MSIEQKVNCSVIGKGPCVVLLHGWGMSSAVWEPVIEELSKHFCLYIVDLPGYGKSAPLDEYTLETITKAIMQVVPDNAAWCGWSLGGLIATYAAIHYSERVNKLIQVASSLKFVSQENWSGVDASVLDNFILGVRTNKQKTLTRFIALQTMGCASARKDSTSLKKLLNNSDPVDEQALIAGLKLLAESDLRDSFSTLTQPCLAVFGRFDSLVPIQASQELVKLLKHSSSQVFEKSSHIPFISESERFNRELIAFIVD